MALNVTVTDFLLAMRRRTDNEGTSATDRFSDLECISYLNRAVASFWRFQVESRGGNYEVSTTTIPTVAGVSLYALSATFYRLLNVNVTIDSRKEWVLPFDENERATLSDSSLGWSGRPIRYSLVGDNIEFLPTPTAVYSVEVRYVPDPPTLAAGGSFNCVNGDGRNYIIDSASVFMAEKDENYELSNALKASVAELKAALVSSLPNRDQNFPPRIQDVSTLPRGGMRMSYRGYRSRF